MKKDDWVEEFITAFGQSNNGFSFMNQNEFVTKNNETEDRAQINEINRDSQGEIQDENLNWQAEDESTGDKYVLELQRKTVQPDKKDVAITFSCLNNKNKFVDSSLENLCDGRYSNYKNESLSKIAKVLCNDYDYIFNYIDTSIAKYADTINTEQAFKIASLAKNEKNMLSFIDYEKITAKLSDEKTNIFNHMLFTSGIKIYYPLNLIKMSAAK